MSDGYLDRLYRVEAGAAGLVDFTVRYRQSDLLISAASDLSEEARRKLAQLHEELLSFIAAHPRFGESLVPYAVPDGAPPVVRRMAAAAAAFGVGPMAAVAGAFAQLVGEELLERSGELLVENGGDLFVASARERIVGIFAGSSVYSGRLALRLPPCPGGMGLCTSSATVGPSLSLGRADAAVVLADDAAAADAAASALGNLVKGSRDIGPALEKVSGKPGVRGCLVLLGEHLGAAGSVELA